MVEVPRHMDQHEHAEQLPLVTEQATVTLSKPMDRNRTDQVLDAICEHLEDIDHAGWLREVKRGSDYDWERLWERLGTAIASDERVSKIKELAARFERPYPSLLQLRVRPDEGVDFVPGQYVTLRAHETPRPYSLANSPTEEQLEFAIRRVPGGRLTSDLFVDVSEGDEVVVRGPNGDMVLTSPTERDLVFLSTGTGVAPFKSMIEYLFEKGWDEYQGAKRQVWLFQGSAWEDDIPYRREFRQLERIKDNFNFVPTLTREPALTDWRGETAYVQYVFLEHFADGTLDGVDLPSRLEPYRDVSPTSDVEARIDPSNVDLYACGITAMVQMLVRAASAAGVPESRMQYEGFG